jgi:hypothetical protein
MIYLDDTKEFKIDDKSEPQKPSKMIAECISELGKNLEKDDYAATESNTEQIVKIINVLSDQIGLGGRIEKDIIKQHDQLMFPILFKKRLLDAFNIEFSESEGFKSGDWSARDGADVMTFPFKDYPGCKLHYGIHWKDNNKICTPFTRVEITIPGTSFFNSFNKYRWEGKRNRLNVYIHTVDYNHDLFKAAGVDDPIAIPPFRLGDGKSIESIRSHKDFNEIPKILAKRALANYEALTVKLDGKPISDILAENYPQENKK